MYQKMRTIDRLTLGEKNTWEDAATQAWNDTSEGRRYHKTIEEFAANLLTGSKFEVGMRVKAKFDGKWYYAKVRAFDAAKKYPVRVKWEDGGATDSLSLEDVKAVG